MTFEPSLNLVPGEDAFVIEHYDVPWYDKEGRYHRLEKDYPVLLRASGSYRQYDARIEISVYRHPIVRYTASGVWIATWTGEKFVNLRARKQWASTTEAEAIDQLWHRKCSQIRILSTRLQEAEEVAKVLTDYFGKKVPAPRPRYYPSEYY